MTFAFLFAAGQTFSFGGALDTLRKDLHPEAEAFVPSALEASSSLSIRSALDLAIHYGGIRARDQSKAGTKPPVGADRGKKNPLYRVSVNDLLEVTVTIDGQLRRFLVRQKVDSKGAILSLVYQLRPEVTKSEDEKSEDERAGDAEAVRQELAEGTVRIYESAGAIFLPVGLLTGDGYPSVVTVEDVDGNNPKTLSNSSYSPVAGTFDGRRSMQRWKDLEWNILKSLRALPTIKDKGDKAKIELDLKIAEREWIRPGDFGSARVNYWMNPFVGNSLTPVAWGDVISWRVSSDGWMDFTASVLEPTEVLRARFDPTKVGNLALLNPDLNLAPVLGKERVYHPDSSYATLPHVQELALQIARTFYGGYDDKDFNHFYFEKYPPFVRNHLFQKLPALTRKVSVDFASAAPARISLSRVDMPPSPRQTHFRFGKAGMLVEQPYKSGAVLRDVVVEGLRQMNDRSHGRAVAALLAPRPPSSGLCKWLGTDRILVVVYPCKDWGTKEMSKGKAANLPFYLMLTPETDYLLDEILVLPEDTIFCYK